jgi:hypothetical protein
MAQLRKKEKPPDSETQEDEFEIDNEGMMAISPEQLFQAHL